MFECLIYIGTKIVIYHTWKNLGSINTNNFQIPTNQDMCNTYGLNTTCPPGHHHDVLLATGVIVHKHAQLQVAGIL